MEEKRLLSVKDAAKYLGVAPNTVRNFASRGYFRLIKLDKNSRIDKIDLDAYIAARKSAV